MKRSNASVRSATGSKAKRKAGWWLAASVCAMTFITPAAAQVTLADVIAAPDDPEINLAYVRQEVASGRLQSAASALERMLLLEPDWDAARLAYGIVLYRLRDHQGAVRELEKLEGRGLARRQELDRLKYLRLARSSESPLTVSGRIALGARIDSNPGAIASDPASRPFLDERDSDGAFTGTSALRVEYDFAGDPGITAFFTVRGALRDYFDTPSSDITDLAAKAGLSFQGEGLEVSIFGTGGAALQDDDLFSRQFGFGTSLAYDIVNENSRTRILAGAVATYETFDDTAFSGIADERDGWRTALDLGAQHFFTDANRLSFGIGYDRKNARNDGFSYDRVELSAGYLTLLGKGVYWDTSASWTYLNYDTFNGFQTFASTGARSDRTWRVRTALGAPLETIFGLADVELPTFVGDIVLQAGVTYLDRSSNLDRYDFDNVGADLLFIKRFQF